MSIREKWFKEGFKKGFDEVLTTIWGMALEIQVGALYHPDNSASFEIERFLETFPNLKGNVKVADFFQKWTEFVKNEVFDETIKLYLPKNLEEYLEDLSKKIQKKKRRN